MPIAWPLHRPALVLSFFFLGFPTLPWVAGEAQLPNLPVEATPVLDEPAVLPGVVIEEIPKDSALEKAGLQVGDVILGWERLPNPPANPEATQGELTSYFDWLELEVEQAPRGVVVLRGRRDGGPLELRVEPGVWEAKVRPVLPRSLEEMYLSGKTHLSSGNIEPAVRVWRSLAEDAKRQGRKDLQAWVALRIGSAWGERTQWNKAEEACHIALESTESPAIQVAAWEALGEAHERRNEYDAAEKAYVSALTLRQRQHSESLGISRSLTHLGHLAWARRDLNRTQDYTAQALRIREKLAPQSLVVAESLGDLGVLASLRGEQGRAYDYTLQALKIKEQFVPRGLSVATSLNNLGVIVQDRGDWDLANDYFLRVLRIQEQLAPRSLTMAETLNNLGFMARKRGKLDYAQDLYLQALEIQQLAPPSLDRSATLNNLGAIARARGELVRANEYYLKALQIREALAPSSLEVAVSLNNLGFVAQERREFDSAEKYFQRALKIEEHLAPESLTVAISLGNLGSLARERGQLNRAYDYYLRARQIQERHVPSALEIAITLNDLAIVAWERGELDSARSYYNQALNALEHQSSKLGGAYHIQSGFRTQYSGFYHSALELYLVQGRSPDAFQILERYRAQTFLTMLAERDTAFTVDIPEELDLERQRLRVLYERTLKALAGLNSRDHAEEIAATRQRLRQLDDEAGTIEARIRQASPRLATLQYPKPFTAAEAQQALDPGTLLLSFSVGKEKTALFALSHSGNWEVKILPIGEEALRSQVKQLLNLLREAVRGSSLGALRQRQVEAASRKLYATLLEPIEERIAASERLLVLPDGPLHVLPFAALVRDAGKGRGQYLAEWKPLHVALSATVFAELKQRRHPASEGIGDEAPIQLAAFGDPVYPQSLIQKGNPMAVADAQRGDPIIRSVAERGIFDWQPLPYTRREVEGIASLFPAGSVRTFLGPEALEDRIKSLDPKTRILHLAAHAHTDEHLPSSSFVALTIPEDTNHSGTGPQHDNGLLQVWEIFERVRLDADLVVLSACDTALGEEQGGEGLIGLTRAFQYAGARTVMASLWSVQDQATSELMIRFYKHLRAGLPKDEALRQAQVELIHGPIEVVNEKGEKTLLDTSSPYFWAGFQLYGDWQ